MGRRAGLAGPVCVIHSIPHRWLAVTENWLYGQVRFSSPFVENHIVCESTENLDQFRVPNIHALDEAPRLRYIWDNALRKVRVRRYLGYLVAVGKRTNAAVLHSHFGPCAFRNRRAARRLGVKHVVTFYGYDVNCSPTRDVHLYECYQKLFEEIDCVLCEGPHMAGGVIALGCPKAKVRVHHLGVDCEQLPFTPRSWDRSSALRVLMAGSFREKKGLPYALEALGQFQHERPVEITIIGDAPSRSTSCEEKRKIGEVIERYQLGERVRMLGFQSHEAMIREAYDHHVFLSPSVTARDGDSEGGAPVAILEMAATGMIIISTTHCDIPMVVHDGETGFLAQERDVEGLVECLHRLTDHPERWLQIQQRARAHIEAQFDARVQGRQLAAIYEELAVSL